MTDSTTDTKSVGTKSATRIWRYTVVEVGGSMEGRVTVGAELIEERNRGTQYRWNFHNTGTGENGYIDGDLIGTGWRCGSCENGIYGFPHDCDAD